MSWSDPVRVLTAALLLAAGGCGFAPAYGPGGTGGAFRGTITVAEPMTDVEFAFVARLEDRLGRVDVPTYDLTYTLVTDEVGLAIDGSNAVTRFNLEGVLDWTLSRDGAAVQTGRETAFTGYSASGSPISTLESERDAERRLMVILADRVIARLLAGDPAT
ncbi:LPS assembly lipoprotein LptE [Jannaschia sp. LMIT008]|uniref:LPS assembly lipoprotein LptE n=1 Tax=Jannaschia maritima TaxID=3032585 RepID=UPI002810BD9B|nr:LPS assembly lipoprotein LptE [Jannaschia sp. LMIT008]